MAEKMNKVFNIAGSAIKSFNDGFKKNFIDANPYEIMDVLEKTEIKKSQYSTESNVERLIHQALCDNNFNTARQYSVGGNLGLKIDLDINNGQVGIELKLAKNLDSAGNIERLFGQVLYYSKKRYKENLIVLVVGTSKEYNHIIKEIEKFIEDLKLQFVYLIAK